MWFTMNNGDPKFKKYNLHERAKTSVVGAINASSTSANNIGTPTLLGNPTIIVTMSTTFPRVYQVLIIQHQFNIEYIHRCLI